jgi:hypothetical protein
MSPGAIIPVLPTARRVLAACRAGISLSGDDRQSDNSLAKESRSAILFCIVMFFL